MNNYIYTYKSEDEPTRKNIIWTHHSIKDDITSPVITQIYRNGQWVTISTYNEEQSDDQESESQICFYECNAWEDSNNTIVLCSASLDNSNEINEADDTDAIEAFNNFMNNKLVYAVYTYDGRKNIDMIINVPSSVESGVSQEMITQKGAIWRFITE